MASLKDGIDLKTASQPYLDCFSPDAGGEILAAYEVENGSLILVKEEINAEIHYYFFDKETSQRISIQDRHLKEHGRIINENLGNNYSSSSVIEINMKTGLEMVNTRLFKNDKIVYEDSNLRYDQEVTSIIDRHIEDKKLDEQIKNYKTKYLEDFYVANFEEKIMLLNAGFRKTISDRYIMGIEPAELFLTREQFKDLDKDKDFRSALRASLGMQADYSDMSPDEIYALIIKNCC